MESWQAMYAVLLALLFFRLVASNPADDIRMRVTQAQLRQRYNVPQDRFGMPKYLLRHSYLAYGSTLLPCYSKEVAKLRKNGELRDYPFCKYPLGLVNTPPHIKVPPYLFGDAWGNDPLEKASPLRYPSAYSGRHG